MSYIVVAYNHRPRKYQGEDESPSIYRYQIEHFQRGASGGKIRYSIKTTRDTLRSIRISNFARVQQTSTNIIQIWRPWSEEWANR